MSDYHQPLRDTLTRLNLSELEAMNLLQDCAAVSDLCVKLDDIAETDIPRAAAYLEGLRRNTAGGFSRLVI